MNLPPDTPMGAVIIAGILVALAFYGLYNIFIRVISRYQTWQLSRTSTKDSMSPSSPNESSTSSKPSDATSS